MSDPFIDFILSCANKTADEYLSGRMSITEATEHGMQLIDEYVKTKIFNEVCEEFYNCFVDVKDIKIIKGEIE